MDGGGLGYKNDFCFEGKDRQYWLNIVKGLSYETNTGPDMDFHEKIRSDEQGAWLRNGGIQNPLEEKARAGQAMYRFISTDAYRDHGDGAIHGAWWITDNDFYKIKAHADGGRYPLSAAASRLLAIPPNWGDCGYFGRVRLTETLRAWTGHGKPASSALSPDHSRTERQAAGAQLRVPMKFLEIKQWFLPGGRGLLAGAMPLEGKINSAG